MGHYYLRVFAQAIDRSYGKQWYLNVTKKTRLVALFYNRATV